MLTRHFQHSIRLNTLCYGSSNPDVIVTLVPMLIYAKGPTKMTGTRAKGCTYCLDIGIFSCNKMVKVRGPCTTRQYTLGHGTSCMLFCLVSCHHSFTSRFSVYCIPSDNTGVRFCLRCLWPKYWNYTTKIFVWAVLVTFNPDGTARWKHIAKACEMHTAHIFSWYLII